VGQPVYPEGEVCVGLVSVLDENFNIVESDALAEQLVGVVAGRECDVPDAGALALADVGDVVGQLGIFGRGY